MGVDVPPLRTVGTPVYIAGVLLVVFCVYANGLSGVFQFDDEHSLLANPHVRSLAHVGDFFVDAQMFSRNLGSQMYRPLVLTSYAVNYYLDGYQPWGYQLVNLIAHAGVVAFAFLVLQQLGMSPIAAAAGVACFGIHPLTSEPVNYISARAESMAVLFYLSSLYFYLRSRPRVSIAALALLACGLACKAIIVTLPLLLLACEYWIFARKLRDIWGRVLPYALLVAAYVFATRAIVSEALVAAPLRGPSLQLATQVKACLYYMRLVVMPHSQSIEHQFFVARGWSEGAVLAALLFLCSLAWLLLRSHHLRGGGYFWLAWVLLAMLPTWVVPLNMLVNERRLYLALIGLAGMVVWVAKDGKLFAPRWLLLAVAIAFAALTVQRNALWASEKALWQDASDHAPLMPRPHLRMGMLLRGEGESQAAEEAYRRVLALDPGYAPAYNNLGNLKRERGQSDEALSLYQTALELRPSYVEAMINLATTYSERGEYARAEELFLQALPLSPQREEIYNNLGTNYLRAGRYSEAEKVLRQVLELDGRSARIYYNLGGALEGLQRVEEAVHAYELAVKIQPSYARAHGRLGDLYMREGRSVLAQRAYEGFLSTWRGAPDVANAVRVRLKEIGR
jgi:tetratricopeptide (TPR) repeat protein